MHGAAVVVTCFALVALLLAWSRWLARTTACGGRARGDGDRRRRGCAADVVGDGGPGILRTGVAGPADRRPVCRADRAAAFPRHPDKAPGGPCPGVRADGRPVAPRGAHARLAWPRRADWTRPHVPAGEAEHSCHPPALGSGNRRLEFQPRYGRPERPVGQGPDESGLDAPRPRRPRGRAMAAAGQRGPFHDMAGRSRPCGWSPPTRPPWRP